MQSRVLDLLTKYRTALLCSLLPVGTAQGAYARVRARIDRALARPQEHDRRVADVQAQVKRWAALPDAERKPLCTDRKSYQSLSTRFEPKHRWHPIRMGALRDILSIDEARGTVRVEPLVTVGQATDYLVARGYLLAVNLEIAEATLGGLSMAVGMTTHSHHVGLLQETVVAYEVVLADGRLVRATKTEHADLFHALPWSHGTLGLLVGLELKIIPCKSHVRLRYTPTRSYAETAAMLREVSTAADAPTFVEATVFDRDHAVVMTGEFAEPDGTTPVNRLGDWHKPWFFEHIRTFTAKGGEELVPLRHYLLRHNRSIFWVVQHMIPFGNHPAFRWLAGWLMPPRISLIKFSTTPAVRKFTFTKQVFQDIVLPMSAMTRALELTEEIFGITPVLLYPSRIYDHGDAGGQLRPPRAKDMLPGKDHAMFFDLGVYGVPRPILDGQPFATVHAMRRMEEFTQSVGGYPFLYADTFMTREEFERMFDLTLYRKVRAKYGADGAFPDLYDKIKPEVDVFAVLDEERDQGLVAANEAAE
jgi:delta24-sterol reductase